MKRISFLAAAVLLGSAAAGLAQSDEPCVEDLAGIAGSGACIATPSFDSTLDSSGTLDEGTTSAIPSVPQPQGMAPLVVPSTPQEQGLGQSGGSGNLLDGSGNGLGSNRIPSPEIR
ncbi:hypothetical protein [Kumtagia ephedrae]|jgi:hypothetical protein|uniref:Intersectin-EH binding protein Ibp1 n=1 Tax=Kumtagia ephedrae TaxID=2116701 RepID=A0A2P7SH46_9HYPH|nr:hypothetical protein [Mesorhizobium ephedrae]PSJ61808.1 hypothetical protein C7I84_09415 [Mesorhizobium ephedrae]